MSNVIATSLPPEFDLMTRMRHRLQSLAYASSLYRMMISGPVPKALEVIPSDPWPGDSAMGESIVDGKFSFAGQSFSAHPPQWLPEKANTTWLTTVHGFEWLRDLRSLGGDTARRVARSLMASWLDRFEQWSPYVWEPHLVALRLTHLIAMHDFVLASADTPFRMRVFECLVRHHKHLLRLLPRAVAGYVMQEDEDAPEKLNNVNLPATAQLQGVELLLALRGLIFAGVAFPDGDKALKLGLEIMPIALRHAILADGSNAERNPTQQMIALKCLVDLRHALKAGKIPLPPELPIAIERAAAALRFYRHGDGALCLFNGAQEENPVMLEALLTQADTRGRAPKNLVHGGYERLSLGRMLVFVDVGAPPTQGLDSAAHAGLSSFECSIGRERLFVNCGAHPGHDNDDWYAAMAATAAHTTLNVDDKNNCEVLANGGIGARPSSIECLREDTKGQQQVVVTHDGYLAGEQIIHQRTLTLLNEGDALRGEDKVSGREGKNITLRFHLHPLVQTSLIQNGKAVLIKMPGGNGYRFRCENGHGEAQSLSLDETLYYGKVYARPSRQIVVRGITNAGDTKWLWSLLREGKSK
ncbi:MAG: heparinase II/III family protein [Alphaproteobacteria bacterium]|nr:heparinase II/III family protein [Alphaproteobacteria bacterium]